MSQESPEWLNRNFMRGFTDTYPQPTTDEPTDDDIEEWMMDSVCEATDGCEVEHDGHCHHGHPSWLLRLGII